MSNLTKRDEPGNLPWFTLSLIDMSVGTFEAQLDLYAVLGVDRNASPSEIRKAHRRLAFLSHPDRMPCGVDPVSNGIDLKLVNLAASVLLDPVRRSRYDLLRVRSAALRGTHVSDVQAPHASPGAHRWRARPHASRVTHTDVGSADFVHSSATPGSVHDGWLVRFCAWAVAATCLLAIVNESFAPPRSDPYEAVRQLKRPHHAVAIESGRRPDRSMF